MALSIHSRHGRTAVSILAAAVTCAVLPAAEAGKPGGGSSAALPKVYLVPVVSSTPDVSPLIPRRFNQQFVQELQTRQAIELLPQLGASRRDRKTGPARRAPTAGRAGPAHIPDRRAEAKSAAAKARRALAQRKYSVAVALCLKAIRSFDASKVYLQHTDHVAKVFAMLAQALLMTGSRAAGIRSVETAMGYDPTLKVNFRTMPRKIRKPFYRAARAVLKKPKATIAVTARPKGATIHIDGDEKGRNKVRVTNVIPGRHYVVVRMEGFAPYGKIVQLAPGGSISLNVKLTPFFKVKGTGSLAALFQKELTNRLKTHLVGVRVKPLAAELAKRVKADFVALAAVERASGGGYLMRTYLFRWADRKLVELQASAFDVELLNLTKGIYTATQALLTAIDRFPLSRDITKVLLRKGVRRTTGRGGTGLVYVTGSGKGGKSVDVKIPLYKKWWVWVTVSAVVVALGGAAVGGYFGYMATHREVKGYRVNINLP
jgi:hypothetical protein